MSIIEPDQGVWDRFWAAKQDILKVYPSSPSVLHTILDRFDVRGMRILEVGAGSGRDSLELARRGAVVTVLDFSQESLALIARQMPPDSPPLRLVRGDAFAAPFADGSFDLVFHQGLLEHFRQPLALLQENYRILAPGGFCLCDVPQTVHAYTIIKKILIALNRWFAGWETQFTMPQLRKIMGRAGFEPMHCYGDWMRPNLFYRVVRELGFKVGVELPKYPFQGTLWQRWKDRLLDTLATRSWAHWTQLSIGVLGRKAP